MTISQTAVDQSIPIFDKFDEIIEGIERAQSLADFGCFTKIGEINEATLFRYFCTLSEILEEVKKLSLRIQEDMQHHAGTYKLEK